jgi:SAM-dependent methyltransferase
MIEARIEAHAGSASADYWRRILRGKKDFCGWQTPRQRQVRNALRACLLETPGPLRVLDFGIGSLGLYRALESGDLLERISLTGISESQQHDDDDPLLARYRVRIALGPGLTPLAAVPQSSHDHVLCTYVFAYLSEDARSEALRAFARVLVPGGQVTLVLHHARGDRARKFRRSEPYWQKAGQLYERLLEGSYGLASALLDELNHALFADFGRDPGYRSYLASYLKTAARFLTTFCVNGRRVYRVPEVALLDCENTRHWIERELAMTCRSFHPIERPLDDLALPAELSHRKLTECVDLESGLPLAHVLTATKRAS